MRVGVVQVCATDDLPGNLSTAEKLIDEAVDRGATFVCLPENFAFMRREGNAFPCAQGLDGEIVESLREIAARHGAWLLGGTFPESIPDDPSRVYNTSTLIGPTGELVAHYRKIHLFDVNLGGTDGHFRESDYFAAGDEIVVAKTPFGGVGMSVCYDLRFPELYREMATRGADFLLVPSAFTPQTGPDHWEVLLRARAIENQAFVVAPAQCGQHSADRASYGRSVVIDPWGLVVARAGDRPEVIVCECDLEALQRVRRAIPALENRRL
jgi:predicted amidohydrolase